MSNHGVGNLHNTHRARMTSYTTDGLGRDTYIGYNNGGFWQDNISTINLIDKFDVPKHKSFHSLRKNVAPFKYYSDGTGRDSYIIYESGGLKRDHKSLNNYHLKDFLRTPQSAVFNFKPSSYKEGAGKCVYISTQQFKLNTKIKQLEKSLTDRLYYSEKRKFLPSRGESKRYKDLLRSYDINEKANPPAIATPLPKIKEMKYNKKIRLQKNNALSALNDEIKISKFS
jgi:hypothetical protein